MLMLILKITLSDNYNFEILKSENLFKLPSYLSYQISIIFKPNKFERCILYGNQCVRL